jgi:hypothetical protein
LLDVDAIVPKNLRVKVGSPSEVINALLRLANKTMKNQHDFYFEHTGQN